MSGKGALLGAAGAGVGFMVGGPLGAAALGSAGMSAGSGMDAAAEAERLAKLNRSLSNEQALEIVRQSKLAAENIIKDGREMTGAQVSAFAASGVDVGSGSALLVMEHTAAQYKRDAYETIRSGNFQGANINRRAQAEVNAAKSGRRAALIGGLTQMGLSAANVGMSASSSTQTTGGNVDPTLGGSQYAGGRIPTRTF